MGQCTISRSFAALFTVVALGMALYAALTPFWLTSTEEGNSSYYGVTVACSQPGYIRWMFRTDRECGAYGTSITDWPGPWWFTSCVLLWASMGALSLCLLGSMLVSCVTKEVAWPDLAVFSLSIAAAGGFLATALVFPLAFGDNVPVMGSAGERIQFCGEDSGFYKLGTCQLSHGYIVLVLLVFFMSLPSCLYYKSYRKVTLDQRPKGYKQLKTLGESLESVSGDDLHLSGEESTTEIKESV
eukprot:comp22233_c0_seq1/m.32785 comp22233_c0_seq1/g.32785  ORF comp22233_c0_seq1/g.32785 comp22233_c0_seq1/m.32785 type:complete len:242 (-) comp22233_c0_seq1:152-877(-)